MNETLIKKFADVGLEMEVVNRPLRRGTGSDIFQLDIQKIDRNKLKEKFRLFPGASTNRLEVLGTDKVHHQVVLMVHEPERKFTLGINPDNVLKSDKVLERGKWTVKVERMTSSVKRHYLCGHDERQLFIAELPKHVSTVKAAHAALKTPVVATEEKKVSNKTVRQGEWFFIPLTEVERSELAQHLRGKVIAIGRKQSVAGVVTRRAHIADERVIVGGMTFVRGSIRHQDHKTVKFTEWHKVYRNAEIGKSGSVLWVD